MMKIDLISIDWIMLFGNRFAFFEEYITLRMMRKADVKKKKEREVKIKKRVCRIPCRIFIEYGINKVITKDPIISEYPAISGCSLRMIKTLVITNTRLNDIHSDAGDEVINRENGIKEAVISAPLITNLRSVSKLLR